MPPNQAVRREPLDKPARAALIAIGLVWLVTVLGGGSARADVIYLVPVRLAAVIGAATLLLLIPRERLRLQRGPLFFAGLVALIIGLQLVPLPPAIWTSLPGREPYAELANVPGLEGLWRPLSLAPDLTWNSLLSLLTPLFFLIAIPVLGRRARNWVLLGMLATIVASGFLGLMQLAGGTESSLRYYQYVSNTSAVGFFANRNHEAVFLAFGIPIAFWWALQDEDSPRRARGRLIIAAVVTLFLLTAALTTESRTGALIVGLSLGLTALYALRRKGLGKVGLAWFAAGLLVSAGLAFAAYKSWAEDRQTLASATDDLRVAILPESLEAARAFFPVGAGYGAFPQAFTRFESVEDLGPLYVNHTHSEVTQVIIEGGIVSVLLFALWLGWLAKAAWSGWRRRGGGGAAEMQLCTALLILPVLASVTDYPLRTPLMAASFAVLAALYSSAAERERAHL
ncbi:MAG TPA: O-antigen ligase family protein [Allosphingosinicella sp.]|nr:O-antigen ligase family protein [Allosphingosinicella sp.]